MPLIVVSGYPSSRKSYVASELADFFEKKGKKVNVITENIAVPKAGFNKNEYFLDSQKEKVIRADLKSQVLRVLNKEDVVILDAGNYIKGYRYELFCASKAARTTQCTVYCAIQKEKAWELNLSHSRSDADCPSDNDGRNNSNVAYTREVFDALCMRFEEPSSNCRWDSPLFVSFPKDELNFDGIFDALFSTKPPPPNQSTQNPPLSATNYLFELDKMTQQIISNVMAARKVGILGPVPIEGTNIKVDVPDTMNAIHLNQLRRQFLNYSKMHTQGSTLDNVPKLFVQFLNASCIK